RVAGHPGVQRLRRVLDEREAAGGLDRDESAHAVVARARQHDPDDARAVPSRRADEQRVDGRAGMVLPWAAAEPQTSVLDEEMLVARSEPDRSGLQRVTVARLVDRKRRPPAEP